MICTVFLLAIPILVTSAITTNKQTNRQKNREDLSESVKSEVSDSVKSGRDRTEPPALQRLTPDWDYGAYKYV